ncbi:MAG: tRNA preQ1(34) S-adenosylmethionine ribosyltransferase-isomerase QueA [Elusimicrobiota bacterium]
MSDRLSDYDFEFPQDLIADRPANPRDLSKLLIARKNAPPEHAVFCDLPRYLKAGDCIIINETRVLPRRLIGRKKTGGKTELLLVREAGAKIWTALSSGLKTGNELLFADGLEAKVLGMTPDGEYSCLFNRDDLEAYLEKNGLPPLPPYILRKRTGGAKETPDDVSRYQTTYAKIPGSIAAPTAGLHFTHQLLKTLEHRGILIARLSLHVGRGTFKPITEEDVSLHRMLPEYFQFPAAQAEKVIRALKTGGRVVPVGTTSMRTLEFLAGRPEGFGPGKGWTDLFIRPGHPFLAAGGLITNFHWPKSTPFLLAAAFLGREKLLAAYHEAFRLRYRLFSYGDAMLILE